MGESIGGYCPGGYHPVHIGDKFHNGRYSVVNKLGSGISVANREGSGSRVSDETAVAQHLQQVRRQIPYEDDEGSNHVIQIIDLFTHQGPNGTHLCIDDPPPTGVAKRIAAQVAYGLRYLHKHGIVHGEPPSEPSDHVPRYFVASCFGEKYISECFADPASLHIKLCDFGESFLVVPSSSDFQSKSSPNQKQPEGTRVRPSHCPVAYRSPELFFDGLHCPASDVWALANLINFLFSSQFLFYDSKLVRPLMVLKLGKFPERWWAMWSARTNRSSSSSSSSSSGSIDISGERWDWFDENEKWCSKLLLKLNDSERVCGRAEEERAMMEKILRKMTVYDIEQRATATEVVELIPDKWMREDPGGAIQWPPDDDS
ncbi:kinase-like domain-containing protein [Rhodocollybia butyracea]|uniref:non-specific serine/threonine protein kinase n=1 Tax=Rhodocollybia butyracea TaxID=206335 RepID=A0A9P5PLS7_9AGAR|nr:kinase-like domain-containing protein [Rhodocollybia butyracea]